ncbi:RluA family pseudouridine synthase [Neobacillus mesonae]|uniref:RluA family pseudouridine synthase n=1 Tax=Neobacillus mesonae TaxID=1193713 RepID=UPI0025726E7F|nr:RluA family pseudouridine synthase [Neobacillus mesonae]MED4205998.1 RluA family pseudouridine synthase [Neobacillus mesonae]
MQRLGDWFQLIILKEWAGITIDELFRKEWEASKKLTHSFRMEDNVQVNGHTINWNTPLSAGSRLQVRVFNEEEIQVTSYYHEIEVLYEDDHLIVVNKPPFMKTHPNDNRDEENTLINAVQFHMLANGEIRNVRQIHRLDRDTSGAILFAKHALAGAILDRKLIKREIKRTYLAMAEGLLRKKTGVIDAPIGRDRHHPTKRRVSSSGQPAITHYQVIKEDKQRNVSYVKCLLETGRTHQIRVHLDSIGHPLSGDTLYGGKPIVNRQALHAIKLEFHHPFTQEKIECIAPFRDNPEIFKQIDMHLL